MAEEDPHQRCFTLAGAASPEQAARMQACLNESLLKGESARQFAQRLDAMLAREASGAGS